MGILGIIRGTVNKALLPGTAIVRMPPDTVPPELSPEAGFFHYAVNAPGQVSLKEQRFLSGVVAGLEGPGPIIEIGTLFGRSTLAITLAKSPERPLLTVDNYSWNPYGFTSEEHQGITRRVLEEACRDWNVTMVRADKDEFYSSYLREKREKPAMVFLDADHSYEATLRDINWAKAAGARVIAGHDYADYCPGVIQAVDDSGGPAELGGSVWVLKPGGGA